MGRFKLLAGVYQGKVIETDDDTGEERKVLKTYKQGDIVESDKPLDEKHGRNKFQNLDAGADARTSGDLNLMRRRIAQLERELAAAKSGKAPSQVAEQDLSTEEQQVEEQFNNELSALNDGFDLPANFDSMDVGELKALAKEQGVDLGGSATKTAIAKKLREASLGS